MKTSVILAGLLCWLSIAVPASAQTATALPYDHTDPAVLNEHALLKIREGDRETALILLERARRLAPYDPRIAENLRLLQEGEKKKVQVKTKDRIPPTTTNTVSPDSLPASGIPPPAPWKSDE